MRKWLPYASPLRTDIWTGVTNLIPTNGASYRTAPVFATVTTTAQTTAGTTLKSWCGLKNDGVGIAYVGTTTKIYSSADGFVTFTDRSKGGGYTNTATDWSMEQFGNITIASNGVDAMQYRDATGAGAFADIAGAPIAKIVVVQSNVLLAFGIASNLHCWQASDVGDYTNWATGDAVTLTPILARPGPITAAIAFRDEVIVFKRSSIYRMRYVGSPIYWTVELIADGIGALTQNSVCSCGDSLIFIDRQGPYIFDGASFRNIGQGFNDPSSGVSILSKTCTGAVYWPYSDSVWFSYDGAGGTSILAYNRIVDAWGGFTCYTSSGGLVGLSGYVLTVGSPAAINAVVTSVSNEERGGAYLVQIGSSPSVVKSSAVWGAGAVALQAYVETGFYGIGKDRDCYVDRVWPIMTRHIAGDAPATAGMTLYSSTSTNTDAATSYGSAVTSSTAQNRFDIAQTAKWHRFKIQCSAKPYEIVDMDLRMKDAGAV